MDQLTINEALGQGYEYYMYEHEGYQSLQHISDLLKEGPESYSTGMLLVSKESYHPSGMSSKDIAELLAEHIEERHSSESGDDTSIVYDTIKVMDFTEVETRIEEALSKLNYYKATEIKLVANTDTP